MNHDVNTGVDQNIILNTFLDSAQIMAFVNELP